MRYIGTALLLFWTCLAAAAEEVAPEKLDDITVTATKTLRKVEEATATTEVAKKADIEATRGNSVGEALRQLPGVQAESSNGAYDTHIIIRGAGAKDLYGVREIKIMVDGVPITDPDSLTRLDMVDTSLIERIEVVKGPNSTLYGANAAGGVINIITKNPFDDPGLTLKMEYGAYNKPGLPPFVCRKVLVFLLALGISLVGAVFQWGDSAHSIGVISAGGGRARHPVVLPSGRDRYMLIETATVLPPYSGDVRLALEGTPAIDCRISSAVPIVDLGLRSWPHLNGDIISGLNPRDRLALWVELRPPRLDPVCGMALPGGATFCSQSCRDLFQQSPERFEFRGEGERGDAGGHQH